jgi:integrase/recombinase XerD
MSRTTSMTKYVKEYLAMRRAFGFQLSREGEQLKRFARYADRFERGKPLTVDMALRWAQSYSTGRQPGAARQMMILRSFATYLKMHEPLTEIPPRQIFRSTHGRPIPHIYSDQEIRELCDAATSLRSCGVLRARSFQTYVSLLACTGMRPPEPLRLTREDVDLQSHIITVRRTKFAKSRIVVLHPTAAEALEEYSQFRDRCLPRPQSPAFFLCDDGRAFSFRLASWAFSKLRRQLGWAGRPGGRPPRLYDLRHTFVCRRLLAWHQDGVDVHVGLPSLSTYLGHIKVSDTYWYMTAIPDLMNTISDRFERFVCGNEEDKNEPD